MQANRDSPDFRVAGVVGRFLGSLTDLDQKRVLVWQFPEHIICLQRVVSIGNDELMPKGWDIGRSWREHPSMRVWVKVVMIDSELCRVEEAAIAEAEGRLQEDLKGLGYSAEAAGLIFDSFKRRDHILAASGWAAGWLRKVASDMGSQTPNRKSLARQYVLALIAGLLKADQRTPPNDMRAILHWVDAPDGLPEDDWQLRSFLGIAKKAASLYNQHCP